MYTNDNKSKIIGNTSTADNSLGFRAEIASIFEGYAGESIDLAMDMLQVIGSKTKKQDFVSKIVSSVMESASFTEGNTSNDPFYGNYAERMEQLVDNSTLTMAREAVITGYAPITAYSPFLLKKQWVSCVWKDVFMAEVSSTPIINYQVEKRFIKDMDGNMYQIPDAYYNPTIMKKLIGDSTGIPLIETAITLPMKNICLIDSTKNTDTTKKYFNDLIVTDAANTLTQDIHIWKVTVVDNASAETVKPTYSVLCDVRVDMTTHALINGAITYSVKDTDGEIIRTLTDKLVGEVNFDTGSITVMSSTDVVTEIFLRGKAANRFNHRGLDVERKIERIQHVVPESGPRINSTVTIEDAADGIVLGNIDLFADKVDMMGGILANFQDAEIKMFADASLNANKSTGNTAQGFGNFVVVESGFNTLPIGNFAGNVSDYLKDSQEYFERMIEQIKSKVNTTNGVITCVCNPSLVRYIKAEVKWVFNDQTDISGLVIDYKMGITTMCGDRIHIITSNYMNADDGIRAFLIPTTNEIITWKHIMYSIVVDKGYRHPLEPLVPNVMSTQRTLTFEVLPIQGVFKIDGRELYSSESRFPVNTKISGTVTNTVNP